MNTSVRPSYGLAVLASLLVPLVGRAEPTITEFPTRAAGGRPQGIVAGPDGNLWVTVVLKKPCVLRVSPAGEVAEFSVPAAKVGVLQGIASGADGNLWVTSREENALRRLTPAGKFDGTFAIPTANALPAGDPLSKFTPGSWPRGIAAGPDGNLWFAEMTGGKIGRLTPDGKLTEFVLPTATCQPYGITAGPDGNLWFTEAAASKVGRITPDGQVTEYATPTPDSLPRDITPGPDGNVWFTQNKARKIGRVTPAGQVTEFAIPGGDSPPVGITGGADGNVWFCCLRPGKIGRVTPAGVVTLYTPPSVAEPFGIAAGPDGNIWYADQLDRVGRVKLDLPRPVVTTPGPTLLGGVGQLLAQSLHAAGGQGGYTWSVAAGTMPPGLTLDAAGKLAGTPTQAGSYAVTLQVADRAKGAGTKAFVIIVR